MTDLKIKGGLPEEPTPSYTRLRWRYIAALVALTVLSIVLFLTGITLDAAMRRVAGNDAIIKQLRSQEDPCNQVLEQIKKQPPVCKKRHKVCMILPGEGI